MTKVDPLISAYMADKVRQMHKKKGRKWLKANLDKARAARWEKYRASKKV